MGRRRRRKLQRFLPAHTCLGPSLDFKFPDPPLLSFPSQVCPHRSMSDSSLPKMKKVGSVSDMDDYSIFTSTLNSFTTAQESLNRRLEASQKRLNSEFNTLDEVVKEHRKQRKEFKELRRMLQEIRKHSSDSEEDKERLQEAELQLELIRRDMEKMRTAQQATGSLFIRFLMGRVNVRMWKDRDVKHFKDEYNKFKFRTTFIFLLFPLLQLLWRAEFLWRIHQVWLIYFYISLALRENILRVNGSAIQPWWIYHHYVCAVVGGVSLMYPDEWSEYISSRYVSYMLFAMFQGLVMLMQHHYQKRRAYVRKALGLNKEIDVDATETIVEKPTDLKILVPLLFLVYIWEFYIGVDLLWLRWVAEKPIGYSSLVIALCFLLLAVGNFSTTTYVLVSKSNRRRIRSALQQMRVVKRNRKLSEAQGSKLSSRSTARHRRVYLNEESSSSHPGAS